MLAEVVGCKGSCNCGMPELWPPFIISESFGPSSSRTGETPLVRSTDALGLLSGEVMELVASGELGNWLSASLEGDDGRWSASLDLLPRLPNELKAAPRFGVEDFLSGEEVRA